MRPESSVEAQPSGESQQTSSPTRGSAWEGDSSSTGGSGLGSDSSSGSELSNENESFLESPTGPKVPSERPPDLPSQEDLSVDQRPRDNPEPISLGPASNLSLKENQNINEFVSIDFGKNEQQIPKKKILRSLRNFPYELIYYSRYCYNGGNVFKQILSEFGIKNNPTRLVKLLFAVAEIICDHDLGEKRSLNNLNHFYYEYIKDIPNGPKPTLEEFDDYLYRWAGKIWPLALDIIHEYSRNKYANR